MKKILIFTQFYLPGYKAGGPIVSISNLVEELKNDFELFIITTDRDAFENKKYENITQNQWIQNKYTNLYYAENKELTVSKIRQLIRNGVDVEEVSRVQYGNIHKVKGMTFDNVIVDLTATRREDYFTQLRLKYVGYSRGRVDCWTIASQKQYTLGVRQ